MTTARVYYYDLAFRRQYPNSRVTYVANWVALWLMTAIFTAIDILLLPKVNISLSADGLERLNPSIVIIFFPVSVFYTFIRFNEKFSSILNSFSIFMVVMPVLCLFTYISASLGHNTPLSDNVLASVDESIGVNWPAMLQWADTHPAIADIGRVAYNSLAAQAALMVVGLTVCGLTERLQAALYAFAIGAFCCGVISALVPALCAYTHYGITPSMSLHIDLVSRDGHLADLLAVRSGSLATFSMESAKGIITFPSFHATLAVVFTWAFWRVPWMRIPVLVLNVAVIAATPLHGSHYVADVLAGFVVAAVVIVTAVALHRRVGSIMGCAGAVRSF